MDAAHFGGWSVFDYALEYLEDENCYVDTSSALEFLGPRRTVELARAYGIERVMFGSDFPMWSPVNEYNMLAAMPFTQKTSSKPSPGTTPNASLAKKSRRLPGTARGRLRPLVYHAERQTENPLPWDCRVLRLMGEGAPFGASGFEAGAPDSEYASLRLARLDIYQSDTP